MWQCLAAYSKLVEDRKQNLLHQFETTKGKGLATHDYSFSAQLLILPLLSAKPTCQDFLNGHKSSRPPIFILDPKNDTACNAALGTLSHLGITNPIHLVPELQQWFPSQTLARPLVTEPVKQCRI